MTSANKGTYTVIIKNTVVGIEKVLTLTLNVKDPCENSVFETNPSPFPTFPINIVINMPTFSLISVPFHVYTDIERANPLVVCPITALFTTSYAHAGVWAPYENIMASPTTIPIPGDYGTHPVTI